MNDKRNIIIVILSVVIVILTVVLISKSLMSDSSDSSGDDDSSDIKDSCKYFLGVVTDEADDYYTVKPWGQTYKDRLGDTVYVSKDDVDTSEVVVGEIFYIVYNQDRMTIKNGNKSLDVIIKITQKLYSEEE